MKVPLKAKSSSKKISESTNTVGKSRVMYCNSGIRRRGLLSKLEQLPPNQKSSLKNWLIKEGLTYHQANSRLLELFGVTSNISAICHFWQRECQPKAKAEQIKKLPNVLLDVILESSRPIRLKILRKQFQLHTKIRVKK